MRHSTIFNSYVRCLFFFLHIFWGKGNLQRKGVATMELFWLREGLKGSQFSRLRWSLKSDQMSGRHPATETNFLNVRPRATAESSTSNIGPTLAYTFQSPRSAQVNSGVTRDGGLGSKSFPWGQKFPFWEMLDQPPALKASCVIAYVTNWRSY